MRHMIQTGQSMRDKASWNVENRVLCQAKLLKFGHKIRKKCFDKELSTD